MENKKMPINTRADHLANERTFLAWIRTGLGIMAFGFVVEKFALFMKQITYFFGKEGLENLPLNVSHTSSSSIFGIMLVAFGVLIGFVSFLNYKKIEKQIDDDTYHPSSVLPILLTIVVVVIGIFLVVYLMNSPRDALGLLK